MHRLMPDEPDYILDVPGLNDDPPDRGASSSARKWIGIQFDCCGVYMRIYRNKKGTAYTGNCPRCKRAVEVRVGPAGTTNRIFRAT